MPRKPMSATDRAALGLLTASQAVAVAEMKAHQQQCAQCRPGKDWHTRACTRGWELAKQVASAAAEVREWNRRGELAEHDGQLRLW